MSENVEIDLMVAKIEGYKTKIVPYGKYMGTDKEEIEGYSVHLDPPETDDFGPIPYSPSSNWEQGGPIIDKITGIKIQECKNSTINTKYEVSIQHNDNFFVAFGPTILIAAMLCYIKLKNGVQYGKES